MKNEVLIANQLEKFFQKTNPESFLKVFVINFLGDKLNHLEEVVGKETASEMLKKYVYNLEQNVKKFEKIPHYHSIYAHYDFKAKTLEYYMTADYSKLPTTLPKQEKKKKIIQEFKIMMYKELERIIYMDRANERLVSNGFYQEDKQGRYPDENGDFSSLMDIFSEVEVCRMMNLDDKIKCYLDDQKEYFVYTRHASKKNAEVLNYVELWRKFFNQKLFYFALNHPKAYAEKLMEDFNAEYAYVLQEQEQFLLKNKDVFSLIENYLLHIQKQIQAENKIQYHQELSRLFKKMAQKKAIPQLSDYVLHGQNKF